MKYWNIRVDKWMENIFQVKSYRNQFQTNLFTTLFFTRLMCAYKFLRYYFYSSPGHTFRECIKEYAWKAQLQIAFKRNKKDRNQRDIADWMETFIGKVLKAFVLIDCHQKYHAYVLQILIIIQSDSVFIAIYVTLQSNLVPIAPLVSFVSSPNYLIRWTAMIRLFHSIFFFFIISNLLLSFLSIVESKIYANSLKTNVKLLRH